MFVYLSATMIGLFGWAYLQVARDPRRYRPFVGLGAAGKLLAVTAATVPWLRGDIGAALPLLIGGDLVLALLFIDFLRRARPA